MRLVGRADGDRDRDQVHAGPSASELNAVEIEYRSWTPWKWLEFS